MCIRDSVIASMDGTDNFSDSYSPALGVVLSRELGSHGAIYFEPIWVNNSNPLPSELSDDNSTFGVEKRAGGHVFQLNFSNSIGTTPGQIARGGFDNDDWYIGFNISR